MNWVVGVPQETRWLALFWKTGSQKKKKKGSRNRPDSSLDQKEGKQKKGKSPNQEKKARTAPAAGRKTKKK